MKIEFHRLPDHVAGAPLNHQLLAKNINSARLRDIAELQMQTGWKMQELRDNIQSSDVLGVASLVFLTLHNAGVTTFRWDDALDLEMDSITMHQEPGDAARLQEADGTGEANGRAASDPAAAARKTPATRSKKLKAG